MEWRKGIPMINKHHNNNAKAITLTKRGELHYKLKVFFLRGMKHQCDDVLL